MSRMRSITLLVAVVFINTTYAQEFSLYDAQSYALENAEQVKQSQLDLETAEKKVVETRAMGLPQISAEGDFQNFINIPTQVVDGSFIGQPGTLVSFRAGTEYSLSGSIAANQLIFDGSYIIGLQVANFYTEFVSSNIENKKEEVLMNVTQAYQMALISERNKTFVDTLVELTQELKKKQQDLFEVGLITQEEVDQTNFSLLSSKANLVAAKTAYENALTVLKMTMAYPMEDEIKLTENLDNMLENQNKDVSGSVSNNLQLDILKKQKILSEYDLKNIKMTNYPRLSGFFRQQYNAFRNDFNFFDSNEKYFPQTVWGIKLSIPIFAGGERWSKIQQSKIAIKQDELAIQQYERNLLSQEIQLKNDLLSARTNLDLQEQNVELARKIYDNSTLKAQIGKENSIVVTQKYNQLVNAQSQYVNAMMEVFTKKLELDQLYNQIIRK